MVDFIYLCSPFITIAILSIALLPPWIVDKFDSIFKRKECPCCKKQECQVEFVWISNGVSKKLEGTIKYFPWEESDMHELQDRLEKLFEQKYGL